ncbi:MAG: BT_3928 family protein [Candidatus Cyclobacteriaceae bacterium M3_2C_046]
MRVFDKIIRIFVGAFFIFSGLLKINDPVGTSIKLKEYFEVFAQDFSLFFEVFVPISLEIAVFVIVMEVVLGVATLIGYRMPVTSWILLLLIIFFTFLTFYSAYFNKVTDCGCFGDAIPLTPWESFSKDVVLLVLILYIFMRRHKMDGFLKGKAGDLLVGASVVVNIFIAVYAIEHLPYIDFRPYHLGANIAKYMQPSEELKYRYIMERNGEEFNFEVYPSDTSYKFKEMVLLNPEAQPKITDYSVWNDEGDFTETTFQGKKMLVIIDDIRHSDVEGLQDIQQLVDQLDQTNLKVMILTATDEPTFERYRHEYQLAIPYYYADATVLEAMIRSNPGLMLLEEGVVLGKWHFNDIPSAEKIDKLLSRS